MQLLTILRNKFLCGTIRRTLSIPSYSPTPTFFSSKFCTQPTNPEQEQDPNTSLSWRIEKLPKDETVASAFRAWMDHGFPIHREDIINTIHRLRNLNSTKRALEVMEWVIRERPYKPVGLDYSFLLEFTTKLHGVRRGETLLSRIPSEFQTDLVYNNLVLACLDKGLIIPSLEYMSKMRELELPISYLVFDRLIILNSRRKKFVLKILRQMKADKVTPQLSTYNILLKIDANNHNVEGLGIIFDDMKRGGVEPNEITFCILASAHAVARLYTACAAYVEQIEKSMTGTNWSTLHVLVLMYGYIGNRNKLEKKWDVIRKLPNVTPKSFMLVVEAFGRIGDYNGAEDIWMEMKSMKGLKSTDQFNALIAVYSEHALITKATEIYEEMKNYGCSPDSVTYRHLTLGYLRAGLMKEAIKTLESGADLITSTKVRKSTSWLETTLSIIRILADHGDVENVEKLFKELEQASYTRYTFVYNTLIKAYVKAKLYDPNLLKRMLLEGAKPDCETYSLLSLVDQFNCDTGRVLLVNNFPVLNPRVQDDFVHALLNVNIIERK